MKGRPENVGDRWIEILSVPDGIEYVVYEVVARKGDFTQLQAIAGWGLHEVGPAEFRHLPVFGQLPMPVFPDITRPTVEVEMLVANETGGWTTDTFDIPAEVVYDRQKEIDREAIVTWIEEHLGRQAQYRHVVTWQLYSISEDQFQDEDSELVEDG
jgi:hypothetical protein